MNEPETNTYRVVLPAEIYFDFASSVPLDEAEVIEQARAALLEVGQDFDGFPLPALPNGRVYRGVLQTLGTSDTPKLYRVLQPSEPVEVLVS